MRGVSLDRLQRRAAPYVFVSPFFVLFAVFGVYPIIHSLYLSFFNQVGVGAPMTFIGADNYLALARDARFVRALFNTSYYAAGSIFVILPTALLAAVILNAAEVRWKHFFRLTYFMPYLTSAVVVAIIFILLHADVATVHRRVDRRRPERLIHARERPSFPGRRS
ncbi:MAG: sugar ABC transporter permease [Chloroflexi bacterium]|nr:sugar ABC transporter permease [Chloroflexota bacterium]